MVSGCSLRVLALAGLFGAAALAPALAQVPPPPGGEPSMGCRLFPLACPGPVPPMPPPLEGPPDDQAAAAPPPPPAPKHHARAHKAAVHHHAAKHAKPALPADGTMPADGAAPPAQ